MRKIINEFAAKSIRDEVFVEGNTFHEYSTTINSRILEHTLSGSLTRRRATDCKRKNGACCFHPEGFLGSNSDFHVSRGSCWAYHE